MPFVRLVALHQANTLGKLMTDYVLNHWGVDKPKSSDTIALSVAIPL